MGDATHAAKGCYIFHLLPVCYLSHTVCIFEQNLAEIETEEPRELQYTTGEVVKPLNIEQARKECATIPLKLVVLPSLAL